MIINLLKNQSYQLFKDQDGNLIVDAFDGAGINRICIEVTSAKKQLIKRIVADECIDLYDGCCLKRIKQNLSIERGEL